MRPDSNSTPTGPPSSSELSLNQDQIRRKRSIIKEPPQTLQDGDGSMPPCHCINIKPMQSTRKGVPLPWPAGPHPPLPQTPMLSHVTPAPSMSHSCDKLEPSCDYANAARCPREFGTFTCFTVTQWVWLNQSAATAGCRRRTAARCTVLRRPGRPWLYRFNEAGLFYSRRHVRQGPPLQPRRAARIINAHCYAATPGCCRASSRGALAARTRLAVSHQAHRPPPTATHAVPLTSPHLHPPTRLSRHPTARDTRRATRPLAHATRGQVSRQNLAGVSTVSRRFRLNGWTWNHGQAGDPRDTSIFIQG